MLGWMGSLVNKSWLDRDHPVLHQDCRKAGPVVQQDCVCVLKSERDPREQRLCSLRGVSVLQEDQICSVTSVCCWVKTDCLCCYAVFTQFQPLTFFLGSDLLNQPMTLLYCGPFCTVTEWFSVHYIIAQTKYSESFIVQFILLKAFVFHAAVLKQLMSILCFIINLKSYYFCILLLVSWQLSTPTYFSICFVYSIAAAFI